MGNRYFSGDSKREGILNSPLPMHVTLDWQPEPLLLEQLLQLAYQKGQSPEDLLTEAVTLYLTTQAQTAKPASIDPLVGLFSGSPSLSTEAEEILQQSITQQSGWTWKPPSP